MASPGQKGRDLLTALENGESVDNILSQLTGDIDLTVTDPYSGNTALAEACRNASYGPVISKLLTLGSDIEADNNNSETPLHIASEAGHTEIVKLLLTNNAKADKEAKDKYGKTPLHTASEAGRTEIVKLLLDDKADKEARDQYGRTPLHTASEFDRTEIVKLLLKDGAIIDAKDRDERTPLHMAESVSVVQQLIDSDANINATLENGLTPIHIATEKEKIDIVKYLIAEGANVNLATKEGKTPLLAACIASNEEIAMALIDAGADVNKETLPDEDGNGGERPLDECSMPAVVAALKEKGATFSPKELGRQLVEKIDSQPINTEEILEIIDGTPTPDLTIVGRNHYTLLMLASIHNQPTLIRRLIKKGANIEEGDTYGNTALILACRDRKTAAAFALIEKEANVNARSNSGNTPLRWAIDTALVNTLMKKGATLTAGDIGRQLIDAITDNDIPRSIELIKKGETMGNDYLKVKSNDYTAFLTAVHFGNMPIVQLLLDTKKINLEEKNTYSENTALLEACSRGKAEIAQLLIKAGSAIEVTNNNGDTPLLAACESGIDNVIRTLLQKGANVHVKNNNLMTPLMLLSQNGLKNTIEILLQKGVNINAKNIDGETALMIACRNKKEGEAILLIDRGADISMVRGDGTTVLMFASMLGLCLVINKLNDKNVNLNAQNNDGNTALLFACSDHHAEAALRLITLGADKNIENNNGEKAINFCVSDTGTVLDGMEAVAAALGASSGGFKKNSTRKHKAGPRRTHKAGKHKAGTRRKHKQNKAGTRRRRA